MSQDTEKELDKVEETVETATEKPDYDTFGYEFNAKVADLIHEYEDKLPVFFMLKILQNIVVDLIFKQVSYQIAYNLQDLKVASEARSKIIV